MPASPWSVKGVDADARAAAKLAARRAGLTLGAWLNQTIRNVAGMQLRQYGEALPPSEYVQQAHPVAPVGPPPPAPQAPPPALQTPQVVPAEGRGESDAAAVNTTDLRAIYETLQELSQRMEAAETRTTGLVEPLLTQVRDLRQQLTEGRGRPGITTAPFERALHRLAERLERLEGTGPTAEEPLSRLNEGRG